ncbi:MAG: hypothetical protein K9G33_10600 [Sneathiella sp.]|nr:hypothetical protein [Sneathiella sp.]
MHERKRALASRAIVSREAAEAAQAAFRTAQAEFNAARAEVELAAAQLQQAEIILEKMTLRAPFDGRLSQNALVHSGDKPFVFTVMPGGSTVKKRQIEVGLSDHARVAIRSGVEEGELVVVIGQHLLYDGMAVRFADGEPSGTGNFASTATTDNAGNHSVPERLQ